MGVTQSTVNTYTCDVAGCTSTLTDTTDDTADQAGWSYAARPWGAASGMSYVQLHCPNHQGTAVA